jgi:hypothetical protein
MNETTTKRLAEVADGVIRPLNLTEQKSVVSLLKDAAKHQPAIADLLATEGPLKAFVTAALSLSPYLRDMAMLDPATLALALEEPIEPLLDGLVADARNAWRGEDDGPLAGEAQVMTRLRVAKRKLSFITALADLARIFDARDTTRWLSAMADACVAAAIDHLLLAGEDTGKLKLADRQAPSLGSGLIVLGMGKLGACELNYSSTSTSSCLRAEAASLFPRGCDRDRGRTCRVSCASCRTVPATAMSSAPTCACVPIRARRRSPCRSRRRCSITRAGGRTGSAPPISRRGRWAAI